MAKRLRQKNFAFERPTWAMPSGQERPIFPTWVANQNTGFASSCPLAEPVIYSNNVDNNPQSHSQCSLEKKSNEKEAIPR